MCKKRAPICLADPLIYTFAIFYPAQMQSLYIHCKFSIKYMVPRVYEMMSYEDFKKNVCVCRYPPQILKVNSSDEFELSLSWVELSQAKLQKFWAWARAFQFLSWNQADNFFALVMNYIQSNFPILCLYLDYNQL